MCSLGCSFTGNPACKHYSIRIDAIFLPAFCYSFACEHHYNQAPFLVEDHFMAILSTRYNILVGYLTSSFRFGSNSLQNDLSCNLYSLLVALGMGVLGSCTVCPAQKRECRPKCTPSQYSIRYPNCPCFSIFLFCNLYAAYWGRRPACCHHSVYHFRACILYL